MLADCVAESEQFQIITFIFYILQEVQESEEIQHCAKATIAH